MRKMIPVCMVASALILSLVSCAGPPPTETPAPPETSAEVLAARDAALTYVREHLDEAPAESLSWVQERLTLEGLVGTETYQYTAGDWVVTISYPFVAPEMVMYKVMVTNQTIGFQWEGRVDAQGRVTEGPEIILAALDVALAHISDHYSDQAPAPELAWAGGRTTPEGRVGAESFQYTAQDWVITVSYPVVAPEVVIYQVMVENLTTGFQWEGELDANRNLTETAPPEGYSPPEGMLDKVAARDAALAYIYQNYQIPPVESTAWEEEDVTPEGLVGAAKFRYTAFNWAVEVSYPVVASEAVLYEVAVTNPDLGLDWQGTVDAQGVVTESSQIEISVYFTDSNLFAIGTPPFEVAVTRSVAQTSNLPEAVLAEFFQGPTEEERSQGLELINSGFTGFSSLNIENGVAHVYLTGPCESRGATYTIAQPLLANLRQFDEITFVKVYDSNGETEDPSGQTNSIPFCLEP